MRSNAWTNLYGDEYGNWITVTGSEDCDAPGSISAVIEPGRRSELVLLGSPGGCLDHVCDWMRHTRKASFTHPSGPPVQKTLGGLLGRSQTAVSSWSRGRIPFKLENLDHIAARQFVAMVWQAAEWRRVGGIDNETR